MPTARAIITSALRRLGAIASGENPSAAEASDGLTSLNELLESWSLENLLILAETQTTQALSASTASYTIGSGGDIAITCPREITQAQLRDTALSPNLDMQVQILNAQQWGATRLKSQTSTYVRAVWLDATFPLATLYVWPIPTGSSTSLILWTRGAVAAFSTLDTSVTLARGYSRALRLNLALELADEYGRPAPDTLIALAADAKATIKRANVKPIYAGMDLPAGRQYSGVGYDWRGDESV